MISSLLIALVAGQTYLPDLAIQPDPQIRPRIFRSDGPPRLTRLGADDYAFFEAFPSSGAGTSGPCSTTAPTGAKGEVLTFARASTATCTKTASGGLATTGIADSDLVFLTANQPRVEFDGAGVLGLLVESASAGGNIALQSGNPCNLAYADVGAPSCSAGAAAGPGGATTMAQFTDASAVAFAGRSQAVADASQTQHTAMAYVKGGTATSATITLVGTGNSAGDCSNTITGLSTTTSSILKCTGAAYGVGLTAVTVTVNVGTVVGDTGTLFVWGYDVKQAAPYATSYIPTTTGAVTRATETADFAVSLSPTAATGGFSVAATWTAPGFETAGAGTMSPILTVGASGGALGAPYFWPFYAAGGPGIDSVGVVSVGATSYDPASGVPASGMRNAFFHNGSAWGSCRNGAACTLSGASTLGTPAFTRIKIDNATTAAANQGNRIFSRVCVDPSWTRCR